MDEIKLIARSALERLAQPGRYGRLDEPAGVTIKIVNEFACFRLVARKDQSAAALAKLSHLFGKEVLDKPKRVENGLLSVSGISPGQWQMVMRGADAHRSLENAVKPLQDEASLVEIGDGCLLLELSGCHVRHALAKGLPIDLDPSVFKCGDVAQTAAFHIGLQIALIDEAPTFEVMTAASTAGSFWSWLTASAGEFGYEIS